MQKRPSWYYNQSAVIPFKKEKGKLKIMLITSLKKQKWILPKGVVELDLPPEKSAEKEALEEAGVKGKIINKEIGEYRHKKWGAVCTVKVYPLEVNEESESWKEKKQRKRKWFSFKAAVKKAGKKEISELIAKLPEYI